MIKRGITALLRRRLAESPAAALVGPRQSGKTTLARSLRGRYFDLEQEADRLRLNLEWDELASGRPLVILDEAQAAPELFPRLRGAIDQEPDRKNRFLLLGSVSPALMTQVSESLAGRLALVELTPLLLSELPRVALSRLWGRGGYPAGGVLKAGPFPHWQRDYLTLLTQRDLPAWGLPAKPQVTTRLLNMLAVVHGQVLNASQLGQSLGLSYHTVNSYLDYLEGAFLIRRLQPYEANLKKRLVRSPKVYWRDTGLLHALLNVGDESELLNQPWVGASWEGFVIEQILGTLQHLGLHAGAFFLRTSDQHEVDLVLDFGRSLWAIEVKLTATPGLGDMERLDKAAGMIKADQRFLLSQTRQSVGGDKLISCSLPWFIGHLGKWSKS